LKRFQEKEQEELSKKIEDMDPKDSQPLVEESVFSGLSFKTFTASIHQIILENGGTVDLAKASYIIAPHLRSIRENFRRVKDQMVLESFVRDSVKKGRLEDPNHHSFEAKVLSTRLSLFITDCHGKGNSSWRFTNRKPRYCR
jgi:hypothetical protein